MKKYCPKSFLIIIAILLTSCSKDDILRDSDWYGADLRLHFNYISTVTMETSNGYSYTHPKLEGTYSTYSTADVRITFNEYHEKLGKTTYLNEGSANGTIKGNTLTFRWNGREYVFTKMKK